MLLGSEFPLDKEIEVKLTHHVKQFLKIAFLKVKTFNYLRSPFLEFIFFL